MLITLIYEVKILTAEELAQLLVLRVALSYFEW